MVDPSDRHSIGIAARGRRDAAAAQQSVSPCLPLYRTLYRTPYGSTVLNPTVEALSKLCRPRFDNSGFDRSVHLRQSVEPVRQICRTLHACHRLTRMHLARLCEIVHCGEIVRDRARSCAAARSCEIVRSGDDGGGGAGGVGVELELRCCCARAAAAASPSGSERESTKRSNVARFVWRGARAGRRMGGRDGHARWARGGGAAVRVELDAPSIRARAAASPSGE